MRAQARRLLVFLALVSPAQAGCGGTVTGKMLGRSDGSGTTGGLTDGGGTPSPAGDSGILADAGPVTHAPPGPGCQFLTSDPTRTVAFCDTFDAPAGTGNRSGDLNGTVWGISRYTGNNNQSSGDAYDWTAAVIPLCGSTVTALPGKDIRICNGQLNDAEDDGGTVTSLDMYPKQMFDISGGRTGTVVFDVSNDSTGNHAAWPELWFTNVAYPEPFTHEFGADGPIPRDGFGIRFAATCDPDQGWNCGCQNGFNTTRVFSVDSAIAIHDFVAQDTFSSCTDCPVITPLDCAAESTGPGGALNHIELRISQNEVDVYATDPGSNTLKEIDTITNLKLSLTRGFIWIEDAHYNGDKMGAQRMHVFTWDNVGFDGPILPRDLTFDALDNTVQVDPGGEPNKEGVDGPTVELGWGLYPKSTGSGSLTVTVPGVTALDKATGAELTFSEWSEGFPLTNTYQLNGGPTHTIPWPFPDANWQWRTFAVPIDVAELQAGTNTVTFLASDPSFNGTMANIANVDIILQGAGQ